MDATRATGATPRRRFLTVLALAPAAAACAGGRGAEKKKPAPPAPASAPAAAALPPDPFAAIRDFPLPAGSEPAFVFRAAPARPRI
jgi:hypothetical protein